MTRAVPPEMPRTAPEPARLRTTGWMLLLFVVGMGMALFFFGWDDAILVARQLSLSKFLILLGLAALHYGIRALRWHILVRANRVSSSIGQNLRHFFGGFAMTATPGRLGELVRLRWLQRETGNRISRLVPIAFGDRAIELASLLLVIAGALIVSNLGTNAVWGLLAVSTALVVFACQPRMLDLLLVRLWRLVGRRKPRLFAKLRRIIRDLEAIMHPSVLVPVLAIGVVGWLFEGVAFWLLLDWLDISLPLATATGIFLVAILAGALSGLPGGFGGTEATGVALLVLQSVPVESAVLAILIIRLTTLWFAVLIGLVVFPFAEARSSARARHASS